MKLIILVWLSMISIHAVLGQNQICTGNLGENIFIGGDFGSGSANILVKDPKIAPGYQYTTNTPPADGYYIITNNSDWPNKYSTWIGIKDNSNDPYGYMMVVNANYTPGIFYEQEITGLCENTLYEFSADVINMVRNPVTNHILPNISFLLDGEVKYNTGGIPQSEQWNKVGFTFTTVAGQGSLKLSLQNNAPGGSGNDLALDNISFRACGPMAMILPETIANICEDGNPIDLKATVLGKQYSNPAIQWQRSPDGKENWTNITGDSVTQHSTLSSGYYYYRYLIASSLQNLANPKCRIVSNVKTVRVIPKFYTIIDTICDGMIYKTNRSTYTRSGIYIDSLKSSLGCDSIVTLRLIVIPDQGIIADKTINPIHCDGGADGSVKLNQVRNGYAPFNIKLNAVTIPRDSTFKKLSKGKYILTIVDHFGCKLNDTIDIIAPLPFVIELGEDRLLNLGDHMLLHLKSNAIIASSRYLLGDQILCDQACEGNSILPFDSGLLTVQAISDKGCVAKDTIHLLVNEIIKAFIPNIFTPNGDGKNDYFTIMGDASNIKIVKLLQVFNRWGGLIYEGKDLLPNDFSLGWDGNTNGRSAEDGAYVYVAKVQLLNDKIKTLSGDILLKR